MANLSEGMKAAALDHVRETFRTPVKNCQTCAHCVNDDLGERFDFCRRFQTYCSCSMSHCGPDLSQWTAKVPQPPRRRRSLRRWLYDMFWAWS